MSALGSDQEALAERIAAGGRDALVERIRAAYAEAAAAHADVVAIREERVEALVQAAADRADALQWRRALARVAADELQIDLTEALWHPSVARAHELVGAPSYEEGLVALIGQAPNRTVVTTDGGSDADVVSPIPGQEELFAEQAAAAAPSVSQQAPVDEAPAMPESSVIPATPGVPERPDIPENPADAELPTTQVHDLDATVEHHITFDDDEPVDELEQQLPVVPESTAAELDEESLDAPLEGHGEADQAREAVVSEGELRVSAYHMGGVANLPINEDALSLRMSPVGLDILNNDAILGRLGWPEIDDIEVPLGRRLLRRDKGKATITVRTEHGDATFEVPGFSADELYELVYPLLERYLPTDD